MRKLLKYPAFSVLFLVLGLYSCSKQNSTEDGLLSISSVFPTIVRGGDTIKITGKNLLQDLANTSISLNGKNSEIILTTPDSIKAIVPLMAGSGTILLKIGSITHEGPPVEYDFKVTVSTIAGNGNIGRSDGPGLQSSFYCPWGITANASGDLFVADSYNRLIRKISAADFSVSSFPISTWVNGKNFYSPYNITVDTLTQNVYVTDFNNHLMKMDSLGNMDVIYIDTMPLTGIAISPSGTHLFISNNTKGTIVRTDMNGQNPLLFTTGLITPRNIIFNQHGQMFVTAYPGPIYEIDNSGKPSAIGAGTGFGGWEVATDKAGNFFLADHFSNSIIMIDKDGKSKKIAGSGEAADIDGIGMNAAFDGPQGITIDSKGILYVTTYNYETRTGNKVRKIVLE